MHSRARPIAAVLVLGATLLVSSVADAPVAIAAAPPLVGACPMPSGNAPVDVVEVMEEGDCFVDWMLDPHSDTYRKAASATMSPSTISFGDGSDQSVSTTFTSHHVWELEEPDGSVTPWTPFGRLGSPEWPCENGCGPGTLPLVRTRWPGGEWGSWQLRTHPPFTLRSPWQSCAIGMTTCSYTLDWLWGADGGAVPDMQVIMPMPWDAGSPDGHSMFVGMTTWFPISVEGGPGTGQPPDASFEIHPYGSSGTQWQFLSTSTDPDGPDQIDSWSWDFGGGVTGFGESVIKSFPVGTVRDVTLTVTDITGRTDSVTRRFGEPDLAITRVLVDPEEPRPGEDVTLTVRVSNPGTGAVDGVAPSLSGVDPSGSLTVVSGPSPASASIAAGATADFTYTVRAGTVDEVSFQVAAAGTSGGGPVTADPVTRVIEVQPVGLRVTLEASEVQPEVDDEVTITATVTNVGEGTVEDVAPGALSVDPAPAEGPDGPEPSDPVDLAGGASTTFTWDVTFARGGPHQLAVDVTGTSGGDPVTAAAQLVVGVLSEVRLNVTLAFVPEDPPPAAGAPFPVDVLISNAGNVPIDDLSLDLSSVAVDGGAVVARVGAAPTLAGSLAPGADRTVRGTFRATKGGAATFRATVDGVDADGEPVSVTVDRDVDISGPQLAYTSAGEDGVVRDMAVGTEHALEGRGWDPDGGPITVSWGDVVVATVDADSAFSRPLSLPPFPASSGPDRCAPTPLVGRQGDLTAELPIAGVAVERILASDDVDLVAAGHRQSISTGVRCKGEQLTAPTSPSALLVTEIVEGGYRDLPASGGEGPTQIAYDGLWFQAADVDMRGVIAREAVIEMPRSGSGPLTRRQFASTLFRDPAFLDPRGTSSEELWHRIPEGYAATPFRLDVWYLVDHPLTFGAPMQCQDALMFGSSWLWFAKGLDTTASRRGCTFSANEAIRVAGPLRNGGVRPAEDDQEQRWYPSLISRRVELLRAGSHVGEVQGGVGPGEDEVGVGPGGDFAVGDDVWIGPETSHGETGEIVGFRSIILSDPLAFAHATGEQILNLGDLSTTGLPVAPPPPGGPGPGPGPGPGGPGGPGAPGGPGGGGSGGSGALARTGTSSGHQALVGLFALAVGALLLTLARRRSPSRPS